MSDWKSPIIAFVEDDDLPLEIGENIFDHRISNILTRAYDANQMRNFDTVGFDHLILLDLFLLSYGLPASRTNKRVHTTQNGEELQFLSASQCKIFRDVLTEFTFRFKSQPEILANVVHREDEKLLETWSQSLPEGDNQNRSVALWRAEQFTSPIDASCMMDLWNANEGTGYVPGSYPRSAYELFTRRPSSHLSCAFQTFGYVKAMQKWCDEAGGLGILEITF